MTSDMQRKGKNVNIYLKGKVSFKKKTKKSYITSGWQGQCFSSILQ